MFTCYGFVLVTVVVGGILPCPARAQAPGVVYDGLDGPGKKPEPNITPEPEWIDKPAG